jgi:hypothetical protein
VPPQRQMRLLYARQTGPQTLRHGLAHLLVGIRAFAGAPANPIGGGELRGEEVDLRPRGGGAFGITEAFGFVEDRL